MTRYTFARRGRNLAVALWQALLRADERSAAIAAAVNERRADTAGRHPPPPSHCR